MIERIELVNFRRHRHSVVTFDASARLILIEGGNGSGKSTLVEAVLWALYGEGRDGRAGLDQLVRRGGEDEGMRVELAFSHGQASYVVSRGRRRGHTTAQLTVNGAVLAVMPSSVTEEVGRLLGVDSAGFRLAAYAQQKELDALGSLQPARRGQMLARLVGVEEVNAARTDAAAEARQLRAALAAVGGVEDVADIDARVRDADRTRRALEEQLAEVVGRLSLVEQELAGLAENELRWQEEVVAKAARQGTLEQLDAMRRDLTGQLAELEKVSAQDGGKDEPPGDVSPEEKELAGEELAGEQEQAAARLELLRQRAADAQRDVELVRHRHDLQQQALQVQQELEALIEQVDESQAATARLGTSRKEHEAALSARDAAADLVVAARSAVDRAAALSETAAANAVSADLLGQQCATCGQTIDAETHASLHHRRQDDLAAAMAQRDKAAADHARAVEDLAAAESQLATAAAHLERDMALAGKLDELRQREQNALSRRDVLDQSIERLPSRHDDLDTISAQLEAARRQHERLSNAALRRQLTEQLERAALKAAQLAAQTIPTALEEAHLRHVDLRAERDGLGSEKARLDKEAAVAAERAEALRAARGEARGRAAARRKLVRQAERAQAAGQILAEVAERMTARIRPDLQSEVSQMLDRLSEGRYSEVRMDDDYNLWVVDDGGDQPLASLSGGEIDLVALAVRLALGSVVAGHEDAGGPDFLILDECFGSQDPGRQKAIVSALRQLEGVYPQVFIISHVPGVRDEVDQVVRVEPEIDGATRTAQIL